ncbi:MAG: translation initiation factor 2, partial [Cereibacter sp.]
LAPAVPAPPEPQPEQAARPDADDPEAAEIDEPEIASAAPSAPTRASVAKQATYRNSINLSKINLIGVYGSSSNRYAMVRQANGRFVRVEVGDRVDGGRVAAISERELHYVKNGTTHKLAMPKG